VPYVKDEIKRLSQRYADRMEEHLNMKNLMRSHADDKTPRRLKRKFPQDLCT